MWFLYLFVKVFVPHVVDGAAGSSHQQSAGAKQGEHAQVWETPGVRGQGDAPGAGQVEQPRSYQTPWTPFTQNTVKLSKGNLGKQRNCLAEQRKLSKGMLSLCIYEMFWE